MICPHCNKTIPEERVYTMSRRTRKDEPLEPWARAVLRLAAWAALFLAALFLVPALTG